MMFQFSSFLIGLLSGITGSMIALFIAAFVVGKKKRERENLE